MENTPSPKKADVEKELANLVIQEQGLPKGQVKKLLEEHGVDKAIIDRVAARLVPYGYTPTK